MGNPIPRAKNIMEQATYQSVVLAKRPKATIVPGETFEVREKEMLREGDLREGQLLVETLYLSLDPAMRGWLNGLLFFSPPFLSTSRFNFTLSIYSFDCTIAHWIPVQISKEYMKRANDWEM